MTASTSAQPATTVGAWMELNEPTRARQTLERARELFPEDKPIRIALERAIAAQSRASE